MQAGSSIAGDSTTVQARRAVETSAGSLVVIPIDVAEEWYVHSCRHGHVWERSSTTVLAAHARLLEEALSAHLSGRCSSSPPTSSRASDCGQLQAGRAR